MPKSEAPNGQHSRMVHGAALSFLGRIGAIIEPVAFIIFARLYGSATFGLFILLWGYFELFTFIADFGMTAALQRFVPRQKTARARCRILRICVCISLASGVIIAAATTLLAPFLAGLINAGVLSAAALTPMIRLYCWIIPLWALVNVLAAAIRARQVFGPEIRIRIFYEQSFRLIAGLALYYAGFNLFGLFLAHLVSTVLTTAVIIAKTRHYYPAGDPDELLPDGPKPTLKRDIVRFGASMVVPILSKKLHSNLPIFFLNALLPGVQGATMIAVYAIARKIVSTLQVIRDSFEYVLAPIAAADSSNRDEASLNSIYGFATRLSATLFLPAAAIILSFREDFLALSGAEFTVASTAIVILVGGRWLEALSGPGTSIVSMIDHFYVPLLNAVGGIAVTVIALWFLVPSFGVSGAALSAALGLNTTSAAAFVELRLRHRLKPHNRQFPKPLAVALILAVLLFAALEQTVGLALGWRALIAGLLLPGVLLLLLRLGYSLADRRTLCPAERAPRIARLIGLPPS